MAEAAAASESALAADEARLARAAAAGDGNAFAELYERYARRAYNLSYRICDSEEDAADAVQEAFLSVMRRLPELDDRELAFGSYLFTATRNATYDVIRKQQRARPSDSIPDSAVPVGAGAGGFGLDPGDPEEDPDRRLMLASQQEEIREANSRLPERQREALALRELEDLSYDEIAELMEMNRNSVAQLISRARINLRAELRGSALASVVASSPECERALPLIAMRDDGQLDGESGDAAWLAAHLHGCERCRVATEAMQEAGVSYRAWVPVAIAPWLFKATMAEAAELIGADWSEEMAAPRRDGSLPGLPPAYRSGRASARRPRRRVVLLTAAVALLLGLGAAAVFADGDDGEAPSPAQRSTDPPAATDGEVVESEPAGRQAERPTQAGRDREKPNAARPVVTAEETSGTPAPESIPDDSDASPQPAAAPGTAKLEATKPASQQPISSQPPQPAPEPTPAPAAETPVEEPTTTPDPVEEPTEERPEREPPAEEPPEEQPEREPPVGKPPG